MIGYERGSYQRDRAYPDANPAFRHLGIATDVGNTYVVGMPKTCCYGTLIPRCECPKRMPLREYERALGVIHSATYTSESLRDLAFQNLDKLRFRTLCACR